MNARKLASMSLCAVALSLTTLLDCGRPEDRGVAATRAAAVETDLKRGGIDDVEVTMDGQIAILTGIVMTQAERSRADEIARRTTGVVGVQNRLAVRQAPSLTSGSKDTPSGWHVESPRGARDSGLSRVDR